MVAISLFAIICAPYPGYLGETLLRVVDLSLISLMLLFAILGAVAGSFRLPAERFVFSLIFVLIGWQLVVIFLSPTSHYLLRDLLDVYKQVFWFVAFVFGLLFARNINSSQVEKAIEIAFCISTIVAALQLLFGPSIFYHLFSVRDIASVQSHYSTRVIGTLGNPNYFALFNVVVFYWALTKSMTGQGRRYAVYALIAFAMVAIAQSRTNIVGMLGLAVVFSFVSFRAEWLSVSYRSFFFKFLIVSVCGLGLILWWMIEYGVLRYVYTGFLTVYESGLASQSSFGGRLKMWMYFSELIEQRPLLGFGPSKGVFRYAVADNNYIFTTFKYGVVGLSLILTLCAYLLFRLYENLRQRPTDESVFAFYLLVMILFTSFFAETIDSMRMAPLLFLLCGLSMGRNAEQDGSTSRDSAGSIGGVVASRKFDFE
jgi:O-antigen ligase